MYQYIWVFCFFTRSLLELPTASICDKMEDSKILSMHPSRWCRKLERDQRFILLLARLNARDSICGKSRCESQSLGLVVAPPDATHNLNR